MVFTFTIYEYIGLKLSFPSLNTSNLVKISSRVKTPGVVEVMERNDRDIYERQQNEINQLNHQIIECLKSNTDASDLVELKRRTVNNHIELSSYFLVPYRFFWIKSHP